MPYGFQSICKTHGAGGVKVDHLGQFFAFIVLSYGGQWMDLHESASIAAHEIADLILRLYARHSIGQHGDLCKTSCGGRARAGFQVFLVFESRVADKGPQVEPSNGKLHALSLNRLIG